MPIRSSQTVLQVLETGGGKVRVSQSTLQVLRSTADVVITLTPDRISQASFLVPGKQDTSVAERISQSAFLVPGETKANNKITSSCFLVPTRSGHQISFSFFKDPTFHDWVSTGDNVNYESYMTTWWEAPDLMEWSQTPYSYYFLKNSSSTDRSLKIQYRWDWSRKND